MYHVIWGMRHPGTLAQQFVGSRASAVASRTGSRYAWNGGTAMIGTLGPSKLR